MVHAWVRTGNKPIDFAPGLHFAGLLQRQSAVKRGIVAPEPERGGEDDRFVGLPDLVAEVALFIERDRNLAVPIGRSEPPGTGSRQDGEGRTNRSAATRAFTAGSGAEFEDAGFQRL
jgi:hypothetical protein